MNYFKNTEMKIQQMMGTKTLSQLRKSLDEDSVLQKQTFPKRKINPVVTKKFVNKISGKSPPGRS